MSIPRIRSYALAHAAEIPENRVQWQLDPQRAVLLIHDMQRYFLNFYEAGTEPAVTVLSHCRRLIDQCRAAGIPIVYTAQPGDQASQDRALLTDFWGPGLADDPNQTDIVPELAPLPGDITLTKWRYSAFRRTDLGARLRDLGRDQLLISGVYAHIGILTTALDAFMEDIQPFVVADAVADFSDEEQRWALRFIAQRCGRVESLAQIEQALTVGAKPAGGLSLDKLRADVAEMLMVTPDEVDLDEPVMDQGLDSIRLMELVERWRGTGVEVSFVALAERPTLAEWWHWLQAQPTVTPASLEEANG